MSSKDAISLLLIEDDPVDNMAFTRLLLEEKLPYKYHLAVSIAEARRILAACDFDVVVTDYKLPDGTAFDLFDVILNKPVIITTGEGGEETAVRALRMGVSDYLVKDQERNYLKLLPHRIESCLRQWNASIELREAQQRYRDIVENATEMIQLVSTDGTIEFVNQSWLRTLRYSESEVLGRRIFDFIQADSRAHCIELLRRATQGENVGRVQTTFCTREGSPVFVEGDVGCTFRGGTPVNTRGIFQDVTERKQAELEREKLIAELQDALRQVQTLSGLLPICAWCKKVRDDRGYWENVETFFSNHPAIRWTHSVCPECRNSVVAGAELPPLASGKLPESPA